MSQRIFTTPPAVVSKWTAHGLALEGTEPPLHTFAQEGNQLVFARFTPSAVYSYLTDASVVGGVIYSADHFYEDDGFSFANALAMVLTAGKVPGAETDLLDNTVKLLFGPVEIARLRVSAAAQKAGYVVAAGPDNALGDARIALIGAQSNITGGVVEADDNIYTKASHGLSTGERVVLASLTGGTGLTATNSYFFHKLSANTGYLCSSYANALAGTAVDVTLDASSVVLTPQRDFSFVLDQVDPALLVDFRVLSTDA